MHMHKRSKMARRTTCQNYIKEEKNMNIYDTANKLATEIKQSEEYKEYKKIKEEINQNPELKEKINQFEMARQEMQKLMIKGGQPVEEKAKEIQDIYAKLIQNEKAKQYFDSEIKFSVMIADVNKIISEAIKDVIM